MCAIDLHIEKLHKVILENFFENLAQKSQNVYFFYPLRNFGTVSHETYSVSWLTIWNKIVENMILKKVKKSRILEKPFFKGCQKTFDFRGLISNLRLRSNPTLNELFLYV